MGLPGTVCYGMIPSPCPDLLHFFLALPTKLDSLATSCALVGPENRQRSE